MWIKFWPKIGKIEITSIKIERIEKKKETGEGPDQGIMIGKINIKSKISMRERMMIEEDRNDSSTFQRSDLIVNINVSIN